MRNAGVDMSVKETSRVQSKPRSGKSLGTCKQCGSQFRLKRKTKHKASKILSGVICPACGAPKKVVAKKGAMK